VDFQYHLQANYDAKHLSGTPVKEQTLKTVARGAKEGVEELVPGTKQTNKALGELLDIQGALQKRPIESETAT